MRQTSSLRSLDADRISTLALRFLQRSSAGRVLHVFPAGGYVQTSAGDVLVVVSEGAPFGPLSIAVPGMTAVLPRISPGLRLRWGREALRIGEIEIRLERSRPWDPYPPWDSLRPRLAGDRGWAAVLRGMLLEFAPPGSLAELHRPSSAGSSNFLVEAARPRARLFQAAVRAAANSVDGTGDIELRRAASALAGLGAGFTPAGDDYMMGTLFAVWTRLESRVARRIGQVVQEAAAPRTTSASAAYLRAAAEGAAGELWHELIVALGGGDARSSGSSLRRLATVGHTSGADALSGFLHGQEALRPSSGGGSGPSALLPVPLDAPETIRT